MQRQLRTLSPIVGMLAAAAVLYAQLKGPKGNRVYVTLRDLVEKTNGASVTRADLQIGRIKDGEIFITSRQDGLIRMLVAD